MKTSLFKQKKVAKQPLSSFKMKAQAEQESLDTLISGLMGNCHDEPVSIPISSSASPMICICDITP